MLRYQNDADLRNQALNQPVSISESIVARRSDLALSMPGLSEKRPGHPHFPDGPGGLAAGATVRCSQAITGTEGTEWVTPAPIWASMVLGTQLSS